MNRRRLFIFSLFFIYFALAGKLVFSAEAKIRIGHFPNVTHAPALIAQATENFKQTMDEEIQIEWMVFGAGPEAIEALFANAIDLLYVGPNPAVNGYVKSNGKALKIIAGVATGGSAFVVRSDSGILRFEDIKGKRVASPQKGNSQDVALRHLMREHNLSSTDQGGDVTIFNLTGGDQITAFFKNQVDAIWTVEPWVSRLISEANGKILFEEETLWPEGKYATTVLVARKQFMDEHPELVAQWVKSHLENIKWINRNLTEAKRIFNEELKREIGKPLPPDYLDRSFARIVFTTDPMEREVLESADWAFANGYLGRTKPDLSELYDLSFLNQARKESGE